jgi:hypothetical protein
MSFVTPWFLANDIAIAIPLHSLQRLALVRVLRYTPRHRQHTLTTLTSRPGLGSIPMLPNSSSLFRRVCTVAQTHALTLDFMLITESVLLGFGLCGVCLIRGWVLVFKTVTTHSSLNKEYNRKKSPTRYLEAGFCLSMPSK